MLYVMVGILGKGGYVLNIATILELSAMILSHFLSSYDLFIALFCTWFLVRWMMRVKAEERDSGSMTRMSLLMPKAYGAFLL